MYEGTEEVEGLVLFLDVTLRRWVSDAQCLEALCYLILKYNQPIQLHLVT